MINLYNMDCMEALREMGDKQFDLAIVDPPYGIGAGKKSFMNGASKTAHNYTRDLSWDVAPDAEYFNQLNRVSQNCIVFGANHIGNFPKSSGWIVWDKTIHGNSYADCEIAFSSFNRPARIFQCNMVNITTDGRIHPTQKPVALYKWLLTNYAKPGDTILDTHLGSGSIAIACHDLGFDLTGYELDVDYYNAACERLRKHQSQGQFQFREDTNA